MEHPESEEEGEDVADDGDRREAQEAVRNRQQTGMDDR